MCKGQQPDKLDAFMLFPDLMRGLLEADRENKGRNPARAPAQKAREPRAIHKKPCVIPPPPPDLRWLYKEGCEEQESVQDIPTALVLMGKGQNNEVLVADLQLLGYRVETAENPAEALGKLKFTDFAAILMHVEFEKNPLAGSGLHRYVTWLPTVKRRTLFYILVGPDFHTLYDLEALALSANLVINDADVKHLKTILRKSFRDHEELFGPFLEVLDGYGKG